MLETENKPKTKRILIEGQGKLSEILKGKEESGGGGPSGQCRARSRANVS